MCGNYILSFLVSSFFISVFSDFLLSLPRALSEYKCLPLDLPFFFFLLVLFSYGNDCDAECWFEDCSQRPAQRQGDQRAEPNCSGKSGPDSLWKRKSASHVTWGYKVHPSPPLPQPKGASLFHHCLLNLNGMAEKQHATLVLAPVAAEILRSPSLRSRYLQQIFRNLFPAALWRTWMFSGVVDHNYHSSY